MVDKLPDEEEDKNWSVSTGIVVIAGIVSKVISDPSQILSGLKQILFFYKLLPKKWQQKAFRVFEKLWNSKEVVISTNPERVEKIYESSFQDARLKSLYNCLSIADKAILLQAKAMTDLIDKGLHGESDEIKKTVEERYGRRGLNIVNMITTGDINYLLDELGKNPDTVMSERKFDYWAENYDRIALLVKPFELTHSPDLVGQKIIRLSSETPKKYVLINLSGKMDECTNLLKLIGDLKDNQKLLYSELNQDISESGFCKSLRVCIKFG